MIAVLLLLTPTPPAVADVLDRWSVIMPEPPEVVVVNCGEYVNGWFYAPDNRVTLCSADFRVAGMGEAILSHELAHAWMHQRGLDGTADDEFSADELGAMFLTSDELYAGARFMLDMAKARVQRKSDPHPADLDRAAMLMCIARGLDGEADRTCRVYLRSIQSKWATLADLTAP